MRCNGVFKESSRWTPAVCVPKRERRVQETNARKLSQTKDSSSVYDDAFSLKEEKNIAVYQVDLRAAAAAAEAEIYFLTE